MAAFDPANGLGRTELDKFIPEVWSMEVLAAYKANLVMAALVSLLPHKGKKGDTIHIPVPVRGAAASKTESTPVTLINDTPTEKTVSLTNHFHYARLFDDIAEVQALASMRRFYTDDAGYALSKAIDTSLVGLAATWGAGTSYSKAVIGSDGSTNWSSSANSNAGNGAAISDAGLRRVVQTFDDNDVPGRNRVLVIPPVEKRKLLGESRFTEQAFTGEVGNANSIRNGYVGNLYGFEIYVSSNLAQFAAADTTTNYRAALAFQKEALLLAEQIGVRVQTQYKLEHLATLMVADTVYGVQTVRGDLSGTDGAGCKAIIVPSL
jgi:N4-gp56 family major capsid protein